MLEILQVWQDDLDGVLVALNQTSMNDSNAHFGGNSHVGPFVFTHIWVLDLGATSHITCNLKDLYNFLLLASQCLLINLPNSAYA